MVAKIKKYVVLKIEKKNRDRLNDVKNFFQKTKGDVNSERWFLNDAISELLKIADDKLKIGLFEKASVNAMAVDSKPLED